MSDLVYQLNTPFQPTQVYSSAPTWEKLGQLSDKIADSAANVYINQEKAKILDNKYQVNANINNAITQTYMQSLEYQNPHDALNYYTKSIEAQKQHLFDNVLPENREYADSVFKQSYDKYAIDHIKAVSKYNGQLLQSTANETFNSLANAAYNTLGTGNTKDGLIQRGQALNFIKNATAMGLPPKIAAGYQQDLIVNSYKQHFAGQYRIAKKNGQATEYRKEFEKGFVNNPKDNGFEEAAEYLGPKDHQDIIGIFDNIDKESQTATGMKGLQLKQLQDKILFDSVHGNINIKDVALAMDALPESSKAPFAQAVTNHINAGNIIKNSQSSNLTELAQQLDTLKERAKTTKDINEYNTIQLALPVLQDNYTTATKDPALAALSNPYYHELLNQQRSNPNVNPNVVMAQYQKAIGSPKIQVLENDKAKMIASSLNQLTPDQAATQFSQKLNSQPAEIRQHISNQIKASGFNMASQRLIGIRANDPVNTDLAERAFRNDYVNVKNQNEAVKSNPESAKVNKAFSDNNPKMIQALLDGLTSNNSKISDYIARSKDIMYQALADRKVKTASDAAALAEKIMNSQYQFSNDWSLMSPTSWVNTHHNNGHVFFYPKAVNKDMMSDAINYVKSYAQNNKIKIPAGIVSLRSGLSYDMYKEQTLADSYLAVKSDENSLVLVDKDKNPIEDSEGNPIEIPFDQLIAGSGDFVNRMRAYKAPNKDVFDIGKSGSLSENIKENIKNQFNNINRPTQENIAQ